MARDFYEILAVPRNASEDQIRQRFRQLARDRHPDRFRGEQKQRAEVEFQEITQAFNILSDPDRRRVHDFELSRPRRPGDTASDPKQLARTYLQRGVKAYHERNLVEAAENFDRATRSDPDNAQAWYNLALTCSQNTPWLAQAAKAIARACELEPMNVGYHKHAGRIFALAGKPELAASHYRKAIEWGENDPAVLQALEDLTRPGKRGLFGKST
ncbi:MAG: DnaJ domain-containing protein [Acidobacteriota bacterium]|nr:DnaJ domain-containing protein [Acidobacteriota bacterium]